MLRPVVLTLWYVPLEPCKKNETELLLNPLVQKDMKHKISNMFTKGGKQREFSFLSA